MFEAYCSEFFLREALVEAKEFRPLPGRENREAWNQVDEEARRYYMEKAEEAAAQPVPQLTASEYLEYSENGNRTHFEDKFHGRRAALRNLILAECLENNGRFIKTILDYTYAVCDEFTWVVPAHNNHLPGNGRAEPMPDSVNFKIVDLFAAETASVLTWTYYFFEDAFNSVSVRICERIRYEIRRRILQPFLSGETMSWMGYHGHKINNWVPWIVCNCIPAAELFAEGQERIILMQRLLTVLDRFLDQYKPDGGCDEGPHYWNAAGAALLDVLRLLYDATGGKIDLFGHELIRNIGEYIMHVHLFDNVFINFADGAPVPDVTAGVVYSYGKCVGSRDLTAFGAELFRRARQPDDNRFFVYRTIKNVLEFKEVKNYADGYQAERQTFLPDLEVCASRDPESGLYAACKGGHNDESHNHNDVGAYMVYKNKQPVIIDPGCETYMAKTFSPQRYTIWTMQSRYHNLPLIGDYMQREGRQYRAEDVNCQWEEEGGKFSLNAEKAYPDEAGVEFFQRNITFGYGKNGFVGVSDEIRLDEEKEIVFYLTLADEPECSDGVLRVNGAQIAFDQADYTVEIQALPLADEKIINDWGGRKRLFHAAFIPRKTGKRYRFNITVQ